MSDKPRFFRTAAAFGEWLAKNHDRATELLVGFYKKDSGKPSITYPEALDEALIVGWIDGVRRNIDDVSYSIRFTPRKARSVWSNVNVKKVEALIDAGRMKPRGLAAFERRDPNRSGIYSYEKEESRFSPAELEQLAADKKAKAFLDNVAPSYRKVVTHWVVSAKKPETRARRMEILLDWSRKGERIPPLSPPSIKSRLGGH
jgi:uncharacterized protein YdeI (YjbR/CyaY-like superfamily)